MVTKSRIFVLLAILILTAVSITGVWADDGDVPASAPAHVVGYFEEHYVVTEMIVVPILAIMLAISMASDTTTDLIRTDHWTFWNRPVGTSYTKVDVPKTPSTPEEIRKTLKVVFVIYLILRLTCLSGFFNFIYRMIGSFIDIPFRH